MKFFRALFFAVPLSGLLWVLIFLIVGALR